MSFYGFKQSRNKDNLLQADSAKKNFAFQFVYQVIILVVPLIVSPYLTRTLGSNSLGVYTYTYSIAYYFVVFAMLGINRHGQRIIAQRKHDFLLLRKTFWSLYFLHFVASVLSLAFYLLYVIFICKSDVDIALIQAIYVFSAAVDITWLFYGLEKFRIVAIRNAVVKLLETICIFCFVKDASDTGIYTLIMSASVCLGQVVMMPQVIRAIPPVRFNVKDVLEHVKPMITLFAAVVAATLYTVFDKTLLGILSNNDNVAFYEYSDKIIKIPRTFITVISNVLFPKACMYAAEKNYDKMRKNMEYSLLFTYFIGFASFFGLAAVADLFAATYYGEAFSICGKVMVSMCPLILIIGLGETVRSSFVYPLKMDSVMVKILTANAIVNLVASCLLIPVIGIYGAVVGTIAAESVGLIAELYLCRKLISIKAFFKKGIPFALFGFIMYVGIRIVAYFIDGSITALLVQILVGFVLYMLMTLIYGLFFNDLMKQVIYSCLGRIKSKIK